MAIDRLTKMSVKQLANVLGTSENTVRKGIIDNTLPRHVTKGKKGKRVFLIYEEEVKEWLKFKT